FAQLRDPQDRRKAEALMEEVKDARTGEIGAEFRRLVEMTREQSPATARQGEEAGLFTQLELTSAKNSRERINDRREKAGQNKLNESHVLFGALMKCFLAKCRINGEDALRLLPQNVEVSRVVKWTGILEDLEFRGADPLRETILS
ncbi:hypothetical protein HY992_05330, partial [Candidatus Micrarchaeota archaeon]|nr:hypothetical protein [Candidatus Micrarchaeota archaeon]